MFVLNGLKIHRKLAVVVACACVLAGCGSTFDLKQNSQPSSLTYEEEQNLKLAEDASLNDSMELAFERGEIRKGEELDVKSLPDDIAEMLPLCQAINEIQYETGSFYSDSDATFVWKCIQAAIINNEMKNKRILRTDSAMEVEEAIVDEYAFAMFAQMKSIPPVSEELLIDNNYNKSGIGISDLSYRIGMIERDNNKSEIIKATRYSDASVEMTVRMVDDNDGSEIVAFNYIMKSNTRNTSISAKFAYEITNVRVADTHTTNFMNGKPYLSMLIRSYGKDLYLQTDSKYNEVVEVPCFLSMGATGTELDDLNKRIEDELGVNGLENAGSVDDSSYVRILTYPVVTALYIQAVVSSQKMPEDDSINIKSYVYDLDNKRALSLEDGLVKGNMDEIRLIDNVKESYLSSNTDAIINGVEYMAFYVKEDNSVEYYVKIELGKKRARDRERKEIASYNSGSGFLTIYGEDEDIVPSDIVTPMEPVLTHGQ